MDEELYEAPVVSDVSLDMAAIGDVFFVAADREVPADYHEINGEELKAYAYPDFVAAMGIEGATFALPTPVQMRDGVKSIIKLGSKFEPQIAIPSEEAQRENMLRRQRDPEARDLVLRERIERAQERLGRLERPRERRRPDLMNGREDPDA